MRLLLIEDNQRLADYLGTALQNGGFAIDHVTTTVDAESALSAIHYDTILLDLGLPYQPGSTLLAELVSDPDTADVPVLVMSGFPEALSEERQAMATAILAKPFRRAQLLNALRSACARERRS